MGLVARTGGVRLPRIGPAHLLVSIIAAAGCLAMLVPPAFAAQDGVASYYGKRFHGRKTASGTRFNMHALTAAHKRWRFGTLVKVTNKANGRSVVVKVNDRGPYIRGRSIDLSYGAARKLGMLGSGTARVRMERVESARLRDAVARSGSSLAPRTVDDIF